MQWFSDKQAINMGCIITLSMFNYLPSCCFQTESGTGTCAATGFGKSTQVSMSLMVCWADNPSVAYVM